MITWGVFTTSINEFLKIDLFLNWRARLIGKICELFWQFGSKKLKIPGRLVAPLDQQAAGAGLVGRVSTALDVPNTVDLDRLFEGSNRTAVASVELL
jgi:hypothetical protein